MFGAKSREIARLNQLLDTRAQQLNKANTTIAIYSVRIDRLGGNLSAARRIDRAVRACARYRHELAMERRVVLRLSTQLFDSLDYNAAARKSLGMPPLAAAEEPEVKP
ncbi:hypothetical protein ACGFW5_30965 [Streptomyces sp. NPDC048416]|uniref:hypothetical protein n=1 Tax=Streptomyces sp. NPDC048416 TaxID=3365546 RepID=UPI003714C2FD